MSVIDNSLLLTAPAGGGSYQVSRSLRFNGTVDNSYLNKSFASSGNRQSWTWAGWVKKATNNINDDQCLFGGYSAQNDTDWLEFGFGGANDHSPADKIYWTTNNTSSGTAAVYRDNSAWYHIVATYDGSNLRFYVNNTLVLTSAKTGNLGVNVGGSHAIGKSPKSDVGRYFNGYLADIHFIDGQALDPSAFTTTDLTTGQLIPKAYTGSYGTNGFKLNFSDNSTTAALGTDTSGNGNTWTVNNFSVTAGSGNDSLVDTPVSGSTVDTGLGGQVTGNYCTWNPLLPPSTTLSNGNLDCTTSGNGNMTGGTVGVSSGKWYFEITYTGGGACSIGIAPPGFRAELGSSATSYAYKSSGVKYTNGSDTSYGASYSSGDVIGVALDLDAGTLVFYKNGTSQGTAFSSLSGTFTPGFGRYTATETSCSANFGQRAFAYTAPSGFKALVDTNLPTPVVAKGSAAMDVKLYTGNGSTQSITGLNFNPDFVWLKSRSSGSYSHNLYDAVRGATKILYSDSTSSENTDANGLTAFNSDGFSLGNTAATNASSTTYVGWCWDAGTSTVTNTAGSITASLRANPSSGFSVSTFTGATTGTIGHGLGVAPSMIFIKARTSNPGANDWFVYHKDLGNTKYLMLNSTAAQGTYTIWNNTSPTSTVFSIGSGIGTPDWVAYCFAPVAGYSSMGSFLGNGSSNGVFVYTGMRPRFLLTKRTDSAESWIIHDTARNQYNVADLRLRPNSSDAEATVTTVDILSNGFKLRTGNSGEGNDNGATYIYAAFAESPFQYARAR